MPKYQYTDFRKSLWSVILIFILLIVGSLVVWLTRPQPVIPKSIQKKAAFTIYIPGSDNKIDRSSIGYNSSNGVLIFTANENDNAYTFSEQGIPDAFHDSDQIYPALLSKLHEYSEIQTFLGAVALTKPSELNGLQSAVIKTSDTLMFIKVKKNISDDSWKSFISSLEKAS